MSETVQRPPAFPRNMAILMVGAVAWSLCAAAFSRVTGPATDNPTSERVVVMRYLTFTDLANGGIEIRDAETQKVVDVAQPGTNGFLRATLRGLAQTRKRDSLSEEVPFRLTGYADHRVVLVDPTSGRKVELEAFGSANVGVFSNLLTEPEKP
jgi:putative photosynthetic complex assembly protein